MVKSDGSAGVPVAPGFTLGASMGASAPTDDPTFLSIDLASFIARLSYILDIQIVYPIIQTRPVTFNVYLYISAYCGLTEPIERRYS